MNYDYMLDCLKAYGVSNITLEYSYDGDSNVTMELPYTGLLHLIKDVTSKTSNEAEEVNIELSFEEFMDFSSEK